MFSIFKKKKSPPPKQLTRWSVGGNVYDKEFSLTLYNVDKHENEIDTVFIRLTEKELRLIATAIWHCIDRPIMIDDTHEFLSKELHIPPDPLKNNFVPHWLSEDETRPMEDSL